MLSEELEQEEKDGDCMSINYHAYQSRGYLFTNNEAQCEQWRTAFSGYDPARAAGILDLEFDETYLYLSYFQMPYRLRREDGVLEKKDGKGWTEDLYFNETMSIYHLLYYTKDHPLASGTWIPNANLDTRSRGRVEDPLLTSFSRSFEGRCGCLENACRALGGEKLDKGDVAYEFYAFPQIPIRMIFWDKDEDFQAQTQILVDSRITDYVHFETTGCMISDLLEKLEKTALLPEMCFRAEK